MSVVYSLPRGASEAVVAAQNWIVARKWICQVPAGGDIDDGCFQLEIVFGQGASSTDRVFRVRVVSSFAHVVVGVEEGIIDVLAQLFWPHWREEGGTSMPAHWQMVLVLSQLARLAGCLDDIIRIDPETEPLTQCFDRAATLYGLAHFDGASFAVQLIIIEVPTEPTDCPMSLEQAPATNRIDPQFTCCMRLPSRCMTQPSFDRLKAGDIVLLARNEEGRLPFKGNVCNVLEFSGGLPITGIADIVKPFIEEIWTDKMITSDTDFSNAIPRSVQPSIGDVSNLLPVTLDVLLASQTISLSKLHQIAMGTTLDLAIDLSAPVKICANGATIGVGHLIQIGENIGVQITQWPAMEAASDV
ncbi:FliM/FliN family flagellar motor switch protein [Brucella intermedia]|uniref:FliM/FliN family flagellar motor switch protein n=1 Tax=Brucella intermedia TaxID=94625 RepID=UPI002361AA49|nr:FliM/FliN family flagellar motor switch protein [Brucella intermedia]